MKKNLFLSIALVLVMFGVSPIICAEPAWQMLHHDAQHTSRSPYVGPTNPMVKWCYSYYREDMGLWWAKQSSVFDTPIIDSKGNIYVHFNYTSWLSDDTLMSARTLVAVDKNGNQKWILEPSGRHYNFPAVDRNDVLYYPFMTFNAYKDFELLWSLDTGTSRSSPLVTPDKSIIFNSGRNGVYHITEEGNVLWNYDQQVYDVYTQSIYRSSPAMSPDGNIYVGAFEDEDTKYKGHANLLALDYEGKFLWSYPFTEVKEFAYYSPVVSDDGTILILIDHSPSSIDIQRALYAIDNEGNLKWSFKDEEYKFNCDPALGNDGTIYITSYLSKRENNKTKKLGKVFALTQDGDIEWEFSCDGLIFDTPSIDSEGTIYVGTTAKLYAIKPDGSLKWIYSFHGFMDDPLLDYTYFISTTPIIGTDGSLYFGGNFGLYCLSEKPEREFPTINIFSDKKSYKTGDIVDIKVHVSNPEDAIQVDAIFAIKYGNILFIYSQPDNVWIDQSYSYSYLISNRFDLPVLLDTTYTILQLPIQEGLQPKGEYKLYAVLTEPGTLNPISDISSYSFTIE